MLLMFFERFIEKYFFMYQRTIVRNFGEPSKVVVLERCFAPDFTDNSALIIMTMSVINPSDLITISDAYLTRTILPFLPGFEGVGIIEKTGRSVTGLKPGDRVIPIGSAGAWQELRAADVDWCLKVPDSLTNEQAAMSYVNPMTIASCVSGI